MATKQEKTVATLGSIAVIGAVLYFTWWKPKQEKQRLADLSSGNDSESTQSFSSADCGCGA